MNFFYHVVILSIAKDLNASTNAFQIFRTESSTTRLHCVQNDNLCFDRFVFIDKSNTVPAFAYKYPALFAKRRG